MLYENSIRARQRYGWKRHIIGIVANLLGGVVIASNGDSSDAMTSTVLGIAVNEASIWTEPERAVTDLDDYRNNFHNAQKPASATGVLLPPLVAWRCMLFLIERPTINQSG